MINFRGKLTLFGNVKGQYLDYFSWDNRNLAHIMNNQANCIIIEVKSRKELHEISTFRRFTFRKNSK